MRSLLNRGLAPWLLLMAAFAGCDREPVLVPEAPAPAPLASAPAKAPAEPEQVLGASAARDGKPPLLGSDPYGLLSKPVPTAGAKREPVDPSKLDPSALIDANGKAKLEPAPTALERDPRAVARGAIVPVPRLVEEKVGVANVINIRADAVASRVIRAGGRPHVLLLYAAYCPACREAMPDFVESARSYASRNVGFTLASTDSEPDVFAAYTPILGGAFEALLIEREGPGTVKAALKRLGIALAGEGYSVPFVAVFDRNRRVVSAGGGEAMAELAKTLDPLLVK